MALFFECRVECARKVLDTADIVRDAIFRQLPQDAATLYCFTKKSRPDSGGIFLVCFASLSLVKAA